MELCFGGIYQVAKFNKKYLEDLRTLGSMIADLRICQAYFSAYLMDFLKLQFHNMINCYLFLA